MTDLVTTSPVVEPLDPAIVVEGAPVPDAAVEVSTDANPAASSTVDTTDANTPRALLDVVKSAVEKPVEPVASSDPVGDPVPSDAAETVVETDPKADDDTNLPFHNHPRWKELVSERDSLRDPAERWGAIENWRQEKNLSAEEVAEGYEIMALLKSGDHESLTAARGWFSDRLDALDNVLGISLPDDLQTRVEDGLLDETSAQELARARAAVNLRAGQDTERAAAAATERTEREAAATTNAMVDAVNGWEERIKASDPDYAKKANQVQDRCLRLVQAGGKAPTTAAEATALADRAYAEITAEFRAALPKPRAIAAPAVGRSTIAAPVPTTLREVVNAAVGR